MVQKLILETRTIRKQKITGEGDVDLPKELYLEETINKYYLKLQVKNNFTDNILDLPKTCSGHKY